MVVGLGAALSILSQTASATCTYNIDNEWSTGFTGTITIKNDAATTINNWNVSWQYSANRIISSWNANVSGTNPYSASNLSWNASIGAGQSASFGFQGEKNGAAAERPTVAGTACNSVASSAASSSVKSSLSSSRASSSANDNTNPVCPSQVQNAFQMYAPKIPTAIQAEDFDPAGYLDSSTTNEGGAYRTDTPVDIKSITGGYAIGWMTAGEWLEYTVYVESEGDFDVTIRSGSVDAGRTLKLSQCGTTLIDSFTVPTVANWGEFKTWSAGKIHLKPGYQKIRVTVGANDYLDLDWIYIGTYTGTIDPVTSSSSSKSSSSSSAASSKKFVGNITTSGAVRSDFMKYWNQITPENEGKWGSVERSRDVYDWSALDKIYAFARQNKIPVKAHNFVWGAQYPSWITSLSPTEQAAEIEEWIRDYCARYPDTAYIDVVNEATPGHAPAAYAKSAFGDNWIIKSFQLAKKYCPNSVLILNDYNVLSWNTTEFINMAKPAIAAGVVDALGLQSHGLEDRPLSDISSKLNQIAALGLPIYISEYDIAKTDDQTQLQIMQTQFPLFYNHPSVKGITLWGYVYGRTWVTGSGLIQDNGTPRPAMTWLMNYLGR